MPAIVYSVKDLAGKNIARFLEGQKEFDVVRVKSELVETDSLDVETDLVVFASRHRSESGKPCLTVHAPGNWGSAELGGKPRELALTSASAIKTAFLFLKQNPLPGFDVFLEVTHHGPSSLKTPCLFVEIGSSEKEWLNEAAAERVAECCLHVCRNWKAEKTSAVLGFGGGHYCPDFGKLEAVEGGHAFSHIAAKYALDSLDEEMLRQALDKTVEPVEKAVLDWKGCNAPQREKLLELFDRVGLEWERV